MYKEKPGNIQNETKLKFSSAKHLTSSIRFYKQIEGCKNKFLEIFKSTR
jgi:hypothetical protein